MAFVVGLVVLGMACGGDDTEPPSGDPPSPGTQETTTTLSPEAEVEEAYLAYWDMLDRLSEAPDPDDPEILDRASGEALVEIVDGLTTLVERGHISESGPLYAHSVESVVVAGNQAVLQDCVIDDSTLADHETGETVEPGEPATGLLEVTLSLDQNRWKVNNLETMWTEPGVISCENQDR